MNGRFVIVKVRQLCSTLKPLVRLLMKSIAMCEGYCNLYSASAVDIISDEQRFCWKLRRPTSSGTMMVEWLCPYLHSPATGLQRPTTS